MKKLLTSLLLITASLLQGQNPDYEMVLFNKMDGLGQDYVYSLVQDKRNFLWIGTGNGLARYNGRSMENFTTADSLHGNFITASALDKNGNIIFGDFSGGLTKYNGNNFTSIGIDEINKKIIGLATSETNGFTWGVTQGGVILKIKESHVEGIHKAILKDKVINSFAVVSNKLLVGSNEGLIVIDLSEVGNLSEGEMPETLEWINVTTIHVTASGSVMVGTEDAGLYKSQEFEKLDFKYLNLGDQFNQMAITSILVNSADDIWIGTKRSGTHLVKFNESLVSHQVFDSQIGYPSFINSIFEDKEGSIWLGTVGEGLVQIVKNQFTHYNFKQLFDVNNITSGVELAKDMYLYTTDNGILLGRYNNYKNKFEFEKHPDENFQKLKVNYISYDRDSTLWFSTEEGKAYTYHVGQNILEPLNLPIAGNVKMRSLSIDSDHNVWLSVAGHGVLKLDKNKEVVQTLNTTNGFIHNDIFSIYADEDDNVWFGAKAAGLAVRRPDGKIERLTQQEVFPSRDINDIKGDHDGNIWISTDGDGLFEFNGEEFVQFDTKKGLYSMYSGAIVVDINNNLWVTHRDGISAVRQDRLNKIDTYSQNQGIFSMNTYYHTLFSDENGSVWFGSAHELIRYNTNSQFNADRLDPFITDLKFYYQKADLSKYTEDKDHEGLLPNNIILPHDQNHLTFDFIAVSLKKRNSIFYKHRLRGYEKQWSPPSTENSATYTNLSPGDYTLLVASSDNQFVWSDDQIEYNFSILKPYWERWWFYAMQVLFFTTLIVITFQVSKNKTEAERNKWILRVLVYVCLFIIFEYLQNFLEPYTENYVGGAPVFKILINLSLALFLFPVEGLVKSYFYGNSKKK